MPNTVFGDYRQQVLNLEEPRLKEGQVGAAALSERAHNTVINCWTRVRLGSRGINFKGLGQSAEHAHDEGSLTNVSEWDTIQEEPQASVHET